MNMRAEMPVDLADDPVALGGREPVAEGDFQVLVTDLAMPQIDPIDDPAQEARQGVRLPDRQHLGEGRPASGRPGKPDSPARAGESCCGACGATPLGIRRFAMAGIITTSPRLVAMSESRPGRTGQAGTPDLRFRPGRTGQAGRPDLRGWFSEIALARLIVEFEGGGVDAVSQAGRGGAVGEDVPEMTAATAAGHLRSNHPVAAVLVLDDLPFGGRLGEAGPAGARVELRVRDEQLRAAAGASVDPRPLLVPVGTREGALRALLPQDVVLLGR